LQQPGFFPAGGLERLCECRRMISNRPVDRLATMTGLARGGSTARAAACVVAVAGSCSPMTNVHHPQTTGSGPGGLHFTGSLAAAVFPGRWEPTCYGRLICAFPVATSTLRRIALCMSANVAKWSVPLDIVATNSTDHVVRSWQNTALGRTAARSTGLQEAHQ